MQIFLTARHLWKELGLDELIDSHMRHTKAKIPVELASFLMVANRLVDPLSKLAISSWYKKKVYLRELENTHFAPHDFYRSMDYLEEKRKSYEEEKEPSKTQTFSRNWPKKRHGENLTPFLF